MTNINANKLINEPDYFIVKIWFKKWKCYRKLFTSHNAAVQDYNNVMNNLMKIPNVIINTSKTDVKKIDISIWNETVLDPQYTVNIVWRIAK